MPWPQPPLAPPAVLMRKPLMRIPYTDILAPPTIVPASASTFQGALAALVSFFQAPPRPGLPDSTVLLTGAGLSVASGLADYRGVKGTYRVNKTYRPIYHYEFVSSHEARKRYWARSFLGWSTLHKATPNAGHYAIRDLGGLGLIRSVITQNVDSFHPNAHPQTPSIELHGYLRSTVCTSCMTEFSRDEFQRQLARLNPRWAALLREAMASGALDTESTEERRFKGLKTNPDGDVDLPEAPYTTFRYPPCPKCLADPPDDASGHKHVVQVDSDGAWAAPSTAGILKPAVVMFGESIASRVKVASEDAIDGAGRLLVLGTSLATYSAWRLAKRAKDRGMPIAIVNMGGVRGEDHFFADLDPRQEGEEGVRVELSTDQLLPGLVSRLRQTGVAACRRPSAAVSLENSTVFKDMLS
ncbi:silencing information regulator [Metarhizium album ARSEF 1941]|uniref:Silencing information regulator n=1 Tax=Metarhizium album (strain ARSEF 1941) TaxID=1081103 RepID=A0A0B2X2Z3_METAS|nr:silencing information regulator [Metarhizium album ARSEF 1941]KHO00699.1 silencing information regulator [Metarhizium album ARSEF 1941]